jgi:aminopeptidase N
MRVNWPGCDTAPLLANAGGVGYYRVAYDTALAARLAAQFGQLSVVDQVSLLADGFALARAGQQPLAVYLDLLQALPSLKEPARTALYSLAIQQLRELELAFRGTPAEPALQRAMRALFTPALEALGWQSVPGEDAQTQALRAGLILTLARLGHTATQQAAFERFDAALPSSSSLPPDIRRAVLGAGARSADAARFDQLLQALKQADSERERWLLANALAQVQQPELALRLMDAAIAGELPRLQAGNLPGAVAENPVHGELVYEHVRRHWAAWSALAGDGVFGGRNWLLPQSAGQLADAAWAERLRADQRALAGPTGASSAATVGARIEARHRLREREATGTAQQLTRRYPQDSP